MEEQTAKEEEGEETGVEDHWYLVDAHGQKFRLPKTMLFLGREECDVVVASQSVDKRHAVLTFDIYLNRFKVKDLSTTHGTYVNNQSIQEQEYVTLNHMDSVRLGNDTMMYHIEQGSQITSQGGHLPDHRVIPSWATRRPHDAPAIHVHTHGMAECQGCIAEQSIEHSCGHHSEKSALDGVHINDPNHCMYPVPHPPSNQNYHYSQQPQCHHHPHQPHPHHSYSPLPQHQLQSYVPSDPQSFQGHTVLGHIPQEQHSQQLEQWDYEQDTTAEHEDNLNNFQVEDQQYVDNNNTAQDQFEMNDNNDNPQPGSGRNTWPRKHVRQMPHVGTLFGSSETADDDPSKSNGSEAKPAGPMSAMYFVSFDDSVCNGSTSDLTASAQRITRTNSKNPLAKELTTIKKGTPLYGQPDWWGESEGADGDNGHATNAGSANQDQVGGKDSRPSSLVLGPQEAVAKLKHQQQQYKPAMASRGSTYMEIPVHDDKDSPSEGATTPNGKDIHSSISKDSLLSPDAKQSANQSLQDVSPSAEKNPAMSFIVDLDDHPPRKINIGNSLSQFVPTKIRKNLLERKDKAAATKGSSAESTPSKNSEERELSPNNQRKIEEIWSSLECKGKHSQLSSVHATAGSSLRSPNLEDIEKLSELSEDRRSAEREGEKKGKNPAPTKGSPQVSRVKVGSVKPVATVSLSQYSDTTTYLIDKMFEGEDSSSVRSSRSSSSSCEKEMSPEQKMYKEAASHNKTTKALSKPPRTSAVHNKKLSSSSSKSDNKPAKSDNKPATSDNKLAKSTGSKDDNNDEGEDEDLKIVEKVNCDDKEDKCSEAGTYTIEADEKEAEEEEQARRRIDEVFGVEEDSLTVSFGRPLIDRAVASPGGYDNVKDTDDEIDDDELDGDKTPLDEYGAGLVDSLMLDDEEEDEEKDDTEREDPGGMGTEGVQTWVSQLTALTNHKASNNISDSAKQAWDEASDTSLTKKPPHGLNRKRPGTGRKLPSIPTDRSPVSSEHSSHVGEQDMAALEDSISFQSSDLLHSSKDTVNGRLTPTKSPQVSSHFSKSSTSKTATTNGHVFDSPPSNVVGDKGQDSNMASPNVSARSRGSVDTELLLQDTETVMAAMEARMANKKSNNHKVDNFQNQDDSDTDVSSTVALVNGNEAYKPVMYRSPREALSKGQQRVDISKSTASASSPSTPPTKKTVGRSYSQTVSSKSHSAASPRNTSAASFTKKSVVSDVLSRNDSFENDSIISDVGSDAGDSTASRSSSKSKGAMSMTKPNRAFQLRRARADSTEEPTTPRSAKASGRSGASVRSASTSRVKSVLDSGRSEASLGTQIVRKSRNNERTDKPRGSSNTNSNSNIERSDGGRHSLRMQRASSLTIAPQAALTYPGKRETTPKSHLKSTLSSSSKGNLSITGVSSGSRPQSQPGSRSNSPKAAERMAWKRRKEYDPRKAVADAKAKTKDTGNLSSASSTSSITMRTKPSTRENLKRRMIRSASFGNAVNLSAHSNDSLSNSHGLGLPERREHHHNEEGFRRAFIPVSGSLRCDRSAHSADEDDATSSVASTQGSGRNVASSDNVRSQLKSAFTPPLINNKKKKSAIPTKSPTSVTPLNVRRRSSFHSTGHSLSLSVAPGLTNMDLDDPSPPETVCSPKTSYDSLIVSSIYQLSLKLSTTTDKTLHRLREEERVSFTPSPIDDFLSDAGKSDIPAWKSANQELAGVLKNLRKLERHVTMMNRVLFPEEDMDSDMLTGREKQKYFQEIERIRSELAGFHPIDNPRREDYEVASPEMEEFSETF